LQQSIQAKLPDPTAMTLATVDGQGQPAQRIVLTLRSACISLGIRWSDKSALVVLLSR